MKNTTHKITTKNLLDTIKHNRAKVIDIRPLAAYNGWQLQGEPRGGHIKTAKTIPLEWTRYMDWVEVLEEKNIREKEPVVVYGYNKATARRMAGQLVELGFDDVQIYDDFMEEWASKEELPMEKLKRYQQLVHPEWLNQLINDENPPAFNGGDYVVCHSHYGYPEDYKKGHIPGAVAVDTNSLESPETWNRRSPEELKAALENLGIRHDTTVVVYGRFSAPVYDEEKFPGKSAGHLGAIRCAAIMMYAGVEDVRILNGGITSWETAGYKLSTEDVQPRPADDFGTSVPAHPEYMIDTHEAKQLIEAEHGVLVSVRSWPEFIGERSGYHYIEKKGRIPGALFGNCGSDAYHMENYRNFDHTMREAGEVAEKWAEEGITPDKQCAFYCGTGWRGSEAFINAYLMGWTNMAVYDGGWFEWSGDPGNPIGKGLPENGT